MDVDACFNFAESPAFIGLMFWVCGAIVATAIIMGLLRAAGRGSDGR